MKFVFMGTKCPTCSGIFCEYILSFRFDNDVDCCKQEVRIEILTGILRVCHKCGHLYCRKNLD
jgi:hypothetical protein